MRLWLLQFAVMISCAAAQVTLASSADDAEVVRLPGSEYNVRWVEAGPLDVFVSSRAGEKLTSMRLLARGVRGSKLQVQIPDMRRPYFALRDADGSVYRTAERLLPLEGGSNFRDLGGYPAANAKHVRWGLLYRSAAMPKLTYADDDFLASLRIKTILDLRSVDERQLSPTDWRAKPTPRYVAIDYPGEILFDRLRNYDGPEREEITEKLYADFPSLLRQEYKALFKELLADRGPLLVQGSAGQDRTGIAIGLILTALGIPRTVIYEDYLLSATDREPANEIADVNLQDYAATNAEARFLIAYRRYIEKAGVAHRNAPNAPPLRDARGRPLLQDAFEQIEAQYGSVTCYLRRELGVSAQDIATLRRLYLE